MRTNEEGGRTEAEWRSWGGKGAKRKNSKKMEGMNKKGDDRCFFKKERTKAIKRAAGKK